MKPSIAPVASDSNKLFIQGKISEQQYEEITKPMAERAEHLESSVVAHDQTLAQISAMETNVRALHQALEDDTIIAWVSSLRGLELLHRRDDQEIQTQDGREYYPGVPGINGALYKSLLGNSTFSALLNWLDLSILVYTDRISLQGLIPADMPLDDVIIDPPVKVSNPSGCSKITYSSSRYLPR